MADERYYESTLGEIPLDDILHPDKLDDVALMYIETKSITGSSFSGGLFSRGGAKGGLAFTLKTEHDVTNNELILTPEDVVCLSDIDDYYKRFYKDEPERGLFIPEELPSFQQCVLCGSHLKEYMGSDEEPYCTDSGGYIWCFEYDRTLVFHGSCIRDLVSLLNSQIEEEPERFVSSSI
jgi:hypothetical protein